VKPQEKVYWFWLTGELPGSIFDDWNYRRAEQRCGIWRRQIDCLRSSTHKRPEEMLEQKANHRLNTAIESCAAWLASRSIGQWRLELKRSWSSGRLCRTSKGAVQTGGLSHPIGLSAPGGFA
jgi:hypothetical protein